MNRLSKDLFKSNGQNRLVPRLFGTKTVGCFWEQKQFTFGTPAVEVFGLDNWNCLIRSSVNNQMRYAKFLCRFLN